MLNRKAVLPATLAVLIAVGALWFTSMSVTPREATTEDIRAAAKEGGYRLITTEEFASRFLSAPQSILVVDTRQDWEYRAGHIKGAKNFPMEPTWWSRWRKADELAAYLGPDKERNIVFYCAGLT